MDIPSSDKADKESQFIVSHLELGSDPPIGSDRELGCDNSRSHKRCQTDGAFSIDTGLEPVGIVGSICWVGSPYNLQPALKG